MRRLRCCLLGGRILPGCSLLAGRLASRRQLPLRCRQLGLQLAGSCLALCHFGLQGSCPCLQRLHVAGQHPCQHASGSSPRLLGEAKNESEAKSV